MSIRDRGKTISIGIFIKIQWANFDELILFNCWLLNIFFPFSSVSKQTYLLRKNRYQLTVFDRLNSYYVFSPDGHKNTKMRVLEACSIAAYHRLTNIPVVSTLLRGCLKIQINSTIG